jgi:arylsulfatase A-like enzyme
MFRRLFQFSVPSLLGVCLAALLAALAETILKTEHALDAVSGAGFLVAYAVPLGLFLSVGGRALHRAWHLDELMSAARDDHGASPRLASWIIFAVLALLLQAWGSFQGVRLLFTGTRVAGLVLLAAPVVVLLVSFAILVFSRPVVGVLERWIQRVEGARASAKKSPLFTPRAIFFSLGLLLLAVLVAIWFYIVRPKLARVDVGFTAYLAVFALGVALFPRVWQRDLLPTAVKKCLAVLVPILVSVCVILSVWMRYERPYSMLEIWGHTTLAGWAIDTTFDVQSLRADLTIEGIEPASKSGASHPNVVVITIDTLRADKVPVYGGKSKMPALKKFARTGVVFDRAYAPGNVTRRSLPTLATGLSPRRIRGRVVGWALRLDPRHVLLAERFRSGGYETAGFFCCEAHFDPGHKLGLVRGLEHIVIDYMGASLTKKSVAWLRRRDKKAKPLFLWTHYIEPHDWAREYKSKDGATSKEDRYRQSLEATDAHLEEFIAGVQETLGDDTIIVITSDHGEGLGEHGTQYHSASLFDTELRVPLVIAGPGINPGRINQVVGLVDLAPTLLDLAGFEAPGMPHMDGLSLAPELRGERKDKLGVGEAYSVMIADRSSLEDQAAVMSGRYKLVERPGSKYQLYDTSLDPKERKDIKAQAPQLLQSMKARLERRREVDAIPAF